MFQVINAVGPTEPIIHKVNFLSSKDLSGVAVYESFSHAIRDIRISARSMFQAVHRVEEVASEISEGTRHMISM